jgi:hypothetical protein
VLDVLLLRLQSSWSWHATSSTVIFFWNPYLCPVLPQPMQLIMVHAFFDILVLPAEPETWWQGNSFGQILVALWYVCLSVLTCFDGMKGRKYALSSVWEQPCSKHRQMPFVWHLSKLSAGSLWSMARMSVHRAQFTLGAAETTTRKQPYSWRWLSFGL